MPNVKKHPIIEIIARKLHGISSVPKEEQEKMVYRACKAAAEMYDEMEEKLKKEIDLLDKFLKEKKHENS